MKKQLRRILFLGGLAALFVSSAFAQDATKPRSITSDDFIKQRPAGKNSGKKNNRRAEYKFVRRDKTIVRRKSRKTKPKGTTYSARKAERVLDIGLTVWKMRPPLSSDTGVQFPVLVNGLPQMWTAERVDLDTIFQADDRVRFAVESSAPGFLYIINSEIYTDGSFGEPLPIFPPPEIKDYWVQPGLLVDIPDQAEALPYLRIDPKKDNYAGELLTVIISPKRLTFLKADKDGKIKNLGSFLNLEENADAEIYSRADNQDKIYTQAEAEAACDSKTRELVREKSKTNPCGTKARQLTREESLPQTIYRVKTQAGMPAVVFIRLRVEK